jgi:hypothetical protein
MSDRTRDNDDVAAPDSSQGGVSEREAAFTRRALIQAGWTAPVVLAAALPQTAAAQSGHTDTHGDVPHNDIAPVAIHTDHTDLGPLDHADHGDHADTTHTDTTHTDTHNDIPHGDFHTDTHGDT